jgi:hypothetical protein
MTRKDYVSIVGVVVINPTREIMVLSVITQPVSVNTIANLTPLLRSTNIKGFMKTPFYADGHGGA